jgi:hypothetical protein
MCVDTRTVVTILPSLPVAAYSDTGIGFANSGYVSHIMDEPWKIRDAGSLCTVVRAGAFLIDQPWTAREEGYGYEFARCEFG